jgi:hypothetical protein
LERKLKLRCLRLLATLAWAFYSWLIFQPKEPPEPRRDWASFLRA